MPPGISSENKDAAECCGKEVPLRGWFLVIRYLLEGSLLICLMSSGTMSFRPMPSERDDFLGRYILANIFWDDAFWDVTFRDVAL
jgi:hypothetical protein